MSGYAPLRNEGPMDNEVTVNMDAATLFGAAPTATTTATTAATTTTTNGTPAAATDTPQETRHIITAAFHIFFRCAAVVLYLFGGLFSFLDNNFVVVFVCIVLLLAADFWTVKNVTGRKLVGLRWWNEVKEDGTSVWRFESQKDRSRISSFDSRVFWIFLYGALFIWALFGLVALLSFSARWLLVVTIAIVLNVANVVGYTKCQKDARSRMIGFATGFLASRLAEAAAQPSGSATTAPTTGSVNAAV